MKGRNRTRRLLAVLTASAMISGLMPQTVTAKELPAEIEEAVADESPAVSEDKAEESILVSRNAAAAEGAQETAAYSHSYTVNAELKDKTGLPGVYFAAAKKGDKRDTATLGMPSIAKQNLQSNPTTESPAIIQGAAVPFERRVATSSRIEFEKISDKPICAPYSKFRWQLIEEANANGTGTHQKISGFDGTYVIVRIDVSEIIKNAPEGSYLHAQVSENKAMLTAVGIEEIKNGDKVSAVSFTDNTGTRAACYELADNAAVLKDKDGLTPDTPYIDVIMVSSGTIVAGADKGVANAPSADFPVSFYVDQTKDYDPSIEFDQETRKVVNSETREIIQDKTDSKGNVIKTADSMVLDKYYNEEKAKEAGLTDAEFTGYTVKADDLELEVMVDETKEDTSTEKQYWSLRRAMDYQPYNRHTIRLMCEVPVLEGLLIEDTEGTADREVVLDVNSFDIQIANHTETNAAGLTVRKGATLTVKDDSNTTGSELAVGNNATMEITDNGKLIIDRTCQVEVEYDSASTAKGQPGEPEPQTPDLSNGVITVNNGGEIVNNGVITVEGKEGKAADPADIKTIIRDYKDACLTIGEGGTLTNNGCVLVNGILYNYGTIINNGDYDDTIVSDDPDKGIFTYHRGMQLSWKDDVTQGHTNGGVLYNGYDGNAKVYKDAAFVNNGDLVLIPGYIYNASTIQNNGNLFMTAVDEVMRPITATQDAPTVTEERIRLGYSENSYFNTYEGSVVENTGSIRTADFEITSNGRTGDMKSEVSPYLNELNLVDWGGRVTNSVKGVIALNMITTRGILENKDNASLRGMYMTDEGKREVLTKVLLGSVGRNTGSYKDSSSDKVSSVFNGALTKENDTNNWSFAKLKELTVSPNSVSLNAGETVKWTIHAKPETEGENIKYLVVLSGDDMEEDKKLAVFADRDYEEESPPAPARKCSLVYDFLPQSAGSQSPYARAVIKANQNESGRPGVSRPTAMQDLVYNGEEQLLLTEGYATEGVIQYKINDGGYSTARPKAKDAGAYKVSYRIVKSAEDDTVLDEGGTIDVTIAKRPVYIAADDTGSRKGEALKALTYTAYGLVESDIERLNIKPETTATPESPVGSYPIVIKWDPTENYEYNKSSVTDGKYFITEKTVNMTVSSNLTGYENMNEGLGGAVRYRNDGKMTEILAKIYYSDKKELNKDNYKTDGAVSLTYAAVGTDQFVYYYVEDLGISGKQRVVITKADRKTPGLKSSNGVLEPVSDEYGASISGLSPREMEYRRSDSDTYKKAVQADQMLTPGTWYVRWIGDGHYNPSPDTEIVLPDYGKKPVTVSFNAAGGLLTSPAEVQVNYGDTVKEPTDPVREGNEFLGWQEDDEDYDFSRPVRYGIELKANWDTEKYDVTFVNNDGGDAPRPKKVELGQKVERPADPVREGYIFRGWKNAGVLYDFSSPVNENLTLVADWDPIVYNVAFDANGGSGSMASMSISYDEDKKLSPCTFTRENFVFGDWTDKADGTGTSYADEQSVKNLSKNNGETVRLYARWKKTLTSPGISVAIDGADDIRYTGQEIRPNVIVKDGDTDITRFCRLTYSDNIRPGKAKVTVSIQGTNAYYSERDTVEKEFEIRKKTGTGSFGEITRSYLSSDDVSEVIEISKIISGLPAGRGTTVFTAVKDGEVEFSEDPEIDYTPGSGLLILRYTTKKTEAKRSGRIIITARMENYEDSSFIVNVKQEPYAIYLKDGKEYEPFDDVLITGRKYNLALMKTAKEPFKNGVTWTSSDPSKVAVSKSGSLTVKGPGKVKITAAASGAAAECEFNVNQAVKKVEISKKSYQMGVGESITLTAGALPVEAEQMVMWSVNKADLADYSVGDDDSITINAKKKGSLKVTAEASDGSKKKATCTISIGDPVTDFTITGKGKKNVVQAGKKLNMAVEWDKSKPKPKNKDVRWKLTGTDGISEVSRIAEISEKGVITGKAEGTVRVAATSVANPSKKAYFDVIVYVPVKKIALNISKGTVSVSEKNELQLGVTVTPVTFKNASPDLKATGIDLESEPSVEYGIDKKYEDKLVILKKGNGAVIKAAPGAEPVKNIPVKVMVEAYNGYKKTLTCKVTVAR